MTTDLPAVPDLLPMVGLGAPIRDAQDAITRLALSAALDLVIEDVRAYARDRLTADADTVQQAGGKPEWEFPGVGAGLRTRPEPKFKVTDEPSWHAHLAAVDPDAVHTVAAAGIRDPKAALALAAWTADGDVWDLAALIRDALTVTATVYVDEARARKIAATFRPVAWDRRTCTLADGRAVSPDGELVGFAEFRLAAEPQLRITPAPELVAGWADDIRDRIGQRTEFAAEDAA